ncbi:transcription factor Tfb2 [Lentinula edodes]|uniref:RNA polymerase II transcription factor B subunit 2 n=1 Tax=Lentinula edodes TaxID=5353 RepID=A0A1Q3E4X8_LENED|nr:transcription factor Tfb2 [Lentinula edodes]
MPSNNTDGVDDIRDLTPVLNKPHALLPFLQLQSATSLSRLYQSPSSCLSIFRLLDSIERQLVMNLLWLESAISLTTMGAWVVQDKKKVYDDALDMLSKLHILHISGKLSLNTTFKTSLRHAITGGFGVPAEKDEKRPPMDIEGLDGYALERWETILHFMVSSGTGQTPTRPSQGVLYLLQRSGLMSNQHGSLPQITSAGFQFLLHPPHAQLWDLLLQYLHMAEERQMDLVEVLTFFFMLSTMELGREYLTENLSQTQKAMLDDLRDYGLIWQRRATSRRFSPTRLATTLTSSSPSLPTSTGAASSSQQGFIVLETNYRVYAYTDNPLQTAVLNLFVSLKYRFPNLVVGSITRDSVRRALNNGISAAQLPDRSCAPSNAKIYQIRLWELEKERLKSQEGYLYTAFASQADYEFVLDYAKQLDVVLWENNAKRCFFGSLEGHSNIRNFIERRTSGAT